MPSHLAQAPGHRRRPWRAAGFVAGFAVLGAGTAAAETLADAIALAYQSHPSLQSQRAQTKALDEAYVQAVTGWRPQLGAQLTAAYNDSQSISFAGGHLDTYTNSGQAVLAVSQALITGGRVSTAVAAAQHDLLASREQLRASETSVLQSTIQAYADCLRDAAILKVREAELVVLQRQLEDAKARRRGGEITETDVLQSLAQLQSARSDLSTAQGQLQVSRAEYATAVGQNPGELVPLPPLPGLPSNVDLAFNQAERDNPSLLQAQEAEQASRWRIAAAKAQTRPEVYLQGSYGYDGALAPFERSAFDHALSAQVVLTQPIFSGGLYASDVRKAIDLNESDRTQIEATRRNVVQQVSQAWNQMLSLAQSSVSLEAEVLTSRHYFADADQEYRVGQKTTLDVLTAEQTLRAAEIAALQARHDAYLGQVALLAAMGSLSQAALVSGAQTYDPTVNFRKAVKAYAVPWEGVVAAMDRASAPRPPSSAPIATVALADQAVVVRPAPPPPSLDAAPATSSPTQPFADTTSPATPATYGLNTAPPAPPRLRGRL